MKSSPSARAEWGRFPRPLLAEVGPADTTGFFRLVAASVTKDGRQYAYYYAKRLSTLFVVTPTR